MAKISKKSQKDARFEQKFTKINKMAHSLNTLFVLTIA
jgi:hypothetical protein